MKGKCKVMLEHTVSYDAEFVGPQVNIVDVCFVDGNGNYVSGYAGLPREIRAAIVQQCVIDAQDKDRELQSDYSGDPFERPL